MIPSTFEYHVPKSVEEATSILSQHKGEAKVLSGGHSLIPLMKLRLANVSHLVDISRISELNYIREMPHPARIHLGATTTHYQIESSELIKSKCPLLSQTAAEIGDVQVRNRGTIGGSLAHADPAADFPAAILALGAELRTRSPRRVREIKAEDFFVDMLTTALEPDEILTEIRIPMPPARTGSAYLKVKQPASGFAIVGVAVQLTLDENRVCKAIGVGITGLASKPFRAKAVEEALLNQTVSEDTIRAAAERATEGVSDPLSDIHASGEFRLHLARVQTRRALQQAAERV
jgi:carbon-monoxide dehydrogenase medium subunit